MKNEALINSILSLLDEYNNEKAKTHPDKSVVDSLRYLIGQIIRHYDIPVVNYHLSRDAQDRWKRLSTDNIMNYHYTDTVICDKLSKTSEYDIYKGASKKGISVPFSKGSKFQFRQMFHEDHVVPVSMILNEMLGIPANKYIIENLLNRMHICILLKEEDRRIPKIKGRSLDYKEVIDNIYKPAGINLV